LLQLLVRVVVAGFGHALALHLDRLGATVFAGCLNAEGPGATKLKDEGSDRIHVLQMDVTSDKQVAECVRYVVSRTNGSGIPLGFFSFRLQCIAEEALTVYILLNYSILATLD